VTSTEPQNPRPEATSPRDRVVAALVQAAIELFGTRGPDAVSLREVAAHAGVNYGLIHHYVGTKDDLISLALREVSSVSTERFAMDDIESTVARLASSDPNSRSLRLLAWSLLQGRQADDLVGRSEALAALAAKLSPAETTQEDRQRVVVLMSLILGWQLFGEYLTDALGLESPTRDSTRRMVTAVAEGVTSNRILD